ncbi:MAG TPA: hypothetical protein VJ953_06015 [Saprospiraceae bacterium]|nr:hypothetical protein [Saprospiraceae bacterium]
MKTPLLIFRFLFLGLSVFTLSACGSAAKNVDQGDFDRAIDQVLDRMEGRKNIKTDWVVTLEEAFRKATARDMAVVDRLKLENRPENWPKIFDVYNLIRRRQDRITNFLPIVSKNGRKANFQFVRVDALELDAKEKAAEYYYNSAQELIDRAEQGDRLAARAAFDNLNAIDQFYQNYRQKASLKDAALELGTTFVLVEVDNRAPVVLPMGFKEALLELNEENLDSRWRVFHTRPVRNLEYDYRAVIELLDLAASPDRVSERQYEQRATVEDGWEYVLDDRGNVKKDSLGNDVKRPKQVEVVANVIESAQTKAATISAALDIIDLQSGARVSRNELTAEAIFENYAATFNGDERALDAEARKRIGNRPVPFPTDEQLMLEAAFDLRRIFSIELRNNRRIQ